MKSEKNEPNLSRMEQKLIRTMFNLSGIRHENLMKALTQMGVRYLKNQKMKKIWSPENPTSNYCYVVSEFVYWYVAPKDSTVWSLRIPNNDTLHWFVKWPDNNIVDLTCEQFPDFSIIDYSKAKQRMFLQTGCKGPSKRAKILAELMGYKDFKFCN